MVQLSGRILGNTDRLIAVADQLAEAVAQLQRQADSHDRAIQALQARTRTIRQRNGKTMN